MSGKYLWSGTLPYVTEIMATSRSSGEALRARSKAKTSSTPANLVSRCYLRGFLFLINIYLDLCR